MFFTALPELKTELSHVSADMEAMLPADWKTGTVYVVPVRSDLKGIFQCIAIIPLLLSRESWLWVY